MSSYLNVHKYKALVLLVMLNSLLLFIAHQSKVQLFGKVEGIGYRWTTYTELYKSHIDSQVHYSKLDSGEENYQFKEYHYEYSKSKGKDYIVLGDDKPVSARHNRVFYIDEQCNVFFFGRAKRTLSNMSFRCLY
ncbi:conserved hypothetical protein [Vibrio harveyi]|nr:conserved hypothetical protein [Vibrio harveyi]CAH1547620.1 conserved hypothetical protein [Vibrio harveyi]CAH1549137.1 conserved hypothetical protein [Vibrio harveyi]